MLEHPPGDARLALAISSMPPTPRREPRARSPAWPALLLASAALAALVFAAAANSGVHDGLARVRQTLGHALFAEAEVDEAAVEAGDETVAELLADDDAGGEGDGDVVAEAAAGRPVPPLGALPTARRSTARAAATRAQRSPRKRSAAERAHAARQQEAEQDALAASGADGGRVDGDADSSGPNGAPPVAPPVASPAAPPTVAARARGGGARGGGDGAALQTLLPADARVSWLQPAHATNEELIAAIWRSARARGSGRRGRGAGAPACAGQGPTSPNAFSVQLVFPPRGPPPHGGVAGARRAVGRATRAESGGQRAGPRAARGGGAAAHDTDGSDGARRQRQCVAVGETLMLSVTARDQAGRRVCEGGDYFEVALTHVPDSGATQGRGQPPPGRFVSRPVTVDHDDGTYSVLLVLPADSQLAGTYDVAITLLFSRYGGLTLHPGWKGDRFFKRPRHVKVRFSARCSGGGGGEGGDEAAGSGGDRRRGSRLPSPPPPIGVLERDANSTRRDRKRPEREVRGRALSPLLPPRGARKLAAGASEGGSGGGGAASQRRPPPLARASLARPAPLPLPLPTPASCRAVPFTDAPLWAGHWVNVARLSPGGCAPPYCTGDSGRLGDEAPGWVYRLPSCYFHLFSETEARGCVGGSWLSLLGDSNHQDTARNLFHYVLGVELVKRGGALPRSFDVARSFDVPAGARTGGLGDRAAGGGGASRRASVRVSNLFNGHYETLGNNLGLRALGHAGLRARHWPLVTGSDEPAAPPDAAAAGPRAAPPPPPPDALVFNSGLHDALFMPGRKWSPQAFTGALASAQAFWAALLAAADAAANVTGRPPPVRLWRHTVTPAGTVNRRLPLNPQKVEVQNRLTAGALLAAAAAADEAGEAGAAGGRSANGAAVSGHRRHRRRFGFIDEFDMTFPWHWDNAWSDGGHYGRPPWHRNKGGRLVRAAHVVDVMLIHVLLNALCPLPEGGGGAGATSGAGRG